MSQRHTKSLERQALHELAYEKVKQAIVNGTLSAGQKLSEPELALQLKISRSPIREALVRLAQDGFVVRKANGRVAVAPLDINELEKLYTVRAHLEGLATRLAAPRLRTLDLEEMGAKLELMRQHIEDQNFSGGIQLGRDFHDIIISECGNEPLLEVLSHLQGRINRFRSVVAGFKDYDPERLVEHGRILDALYRRDAAGAEAEMVGHINRSATVLVAKLRNRGDIAENKSSNAILSHGKGG